MDLAKEYKAKTSEIKGHLFKLLHTGLSVHVDLRSELANAKTYEDRLKVVVEMI